MRSASLLAIASIVTVAASAATVDLTFLGSTDLHGTPNVAKLAKWIRAERAADPELLLFDCGDLCNGTFATYCDGGASMVSYLNACKYDAWVPGNHEFRIGNANFRKDVSLFKSGSFLAANLVFDDDSRRPSVPVLPWKMFTRKGLKVAVVGLTQHRYDWWYDVKPYAGIRLLSPADALKNVMPSVRAAKPDVTVLVMHNDMGQPAETVTGNENWVSTKEILAAYPEIVLVFEGHTHRRVPLTEFAPGRWLIQPQDHGVNMAKAVLRYDTDAHRVVSATGELVESAKLTPLDDAEMPAEWRANNAAAAEAAKKPIVRLPAEYVWDAKAQKGGLPPEFLAEAMRAAAGSDAAIICARENLRPAKADLTAEFFYELPKSGISVLTLTPAQLKAALAAEGNIDGRAVGIDPKNLPAKPITVAFDAYDLTGCDGERMGLVDLVKSGVPRREIEPSVREAARLYALKRWPVKTKVMLFFDTEDFTCDKSSDAIRDLAKILTEEGVVGEFNIVGLLAREIVRNRRQDVIDALKGHAIGTQTYGHSFHPTICEKTDMPDYRVAYRNALRDESIGVGMLEAAFGIDHVDYAVPPGDSWSYASMYAFADMGMMFYGGGGFEDWQGGEGLVPTGNRHWQMWYCNLRQIPYSYSFSLEDIMPFDYIKTPPDIDKLLDRVAGRDGIVWSFHPHMALKKRHWDGPNYKGANLVEWGQWKMVEDWPEEVTQKFYRDFRAFLKRVKADGRFEFTNTFELRRETKPRVAIARGDVKRIRAALLADFGPMDDPSWSVADLFQAAATFLRGRDRKFVPTKAYGFLDRPRGVKAPVTVSAEDLRAAAKGLDLTTFIPASIKVGAAEIGPADFLFAALEVLDTGAKSVTVTPREQLGSFKNCPSLERVDIMAGWPIHSPKLNAKLLDERLKLQLWTLRFE